LRPGAIPDYVSLQAAIWNISRLLTIELILPLQHEFLPIFIANIKEKDELFIDP